MKLLIYAALTALIIFARAPECKGAQIQLLVWGISPSADSKDTDAEIAAFEKSHSNIKVVTLSMGGSMNPQKLMTAIVGGVPPDVINQDRFTIGDWASRGAFEKLDPFIESDQASGIANAVRQKDYIPAAWAEASYRSNVFAIPDGIDVRILYYNKQLFRDVGLNPNRPPQTWDEMIADAKKLSVRAPGGGFTRLGFDPTYVQGGLYIWSWQEDGDPMSEGGRTCTLNNPRTVLALKSMDEWFDELGGLDAISSFAGGFQSESGAIDPFLSGDLAMKTDDDTFINNIARYAPNLDFGTAPIPVPSNRYHHIGRFKNDPAFITWAGGFSLVIPRGARHPKEAWEFIRWMTSPEAAAIGAKAQAEFQHAKGLPYVPALSPNIITNRELDSKYLPLVAPKLRNAEQTALTLLPTTKFRPVTFVGLLLSDQANRATDAALRHLKTPKQALDDATRVVQIQLDQVYKAGDHPLLPVREVTFVMLGLVLILLAAIILYLINWMNRHKLAARSEALGGMLFVSPWIFGFVVFTLGPILASLVISFCDYDVLHPARFVGLNNYISLVTVDRPLVTKSLINAFYLGIIGVPLGMAFGLTLAMLLNTKLAGLNWYRTFFYIPSIVPVVATAVLWAWILNPDPHRGLVNAVWMLTITRWFNVAPPGWLAVPEWSKPAMIIMGLWGAGGGMILWLAGLQSIPAALYEAASLDGAGGWQKFRHITLPVLSPYIFFNAILGVIGTLQTFESAYILGGTGNGGSTGPDDSLLLPVVYLFNYAFQYFKMGYASAIAWLLFVLILGLTLGQLKLAPLWVHYEADIKN